MDATRAGLAMLAVLLVAIPAAGHVPAFPEDNTAPERAVVVPDAVKSWSFYDRLNRGEVRYYRFSLEAGQRLRVGAFTPARGDFTPSVVLMSPSLDGTDDVPPAVTVPEGMGAVVVVGERPDEATYEMFAPSASYHTVDIDRRVESDRTYLVAVYEPRNLTGQVGVTVGYAEQFSPAEYLTVSVDIVRTHLWEGQHPLVVFGPWLATFVVGAALARSRVRRRSERGRDGESLSEQRRPGESAVRYGLAGAGLLVAGTGVSALVQTGIALAATGPTAGALVTAVFVVVPLVCGGWALRVAGRPEPLTARRRVGLGVAGVASLLTWAGFVVAPVALLVVAVLPRRVLER